MNNEKIKTLLLEIEDAPLDFSVVLSGKKSRKVNGLYKPAEREIILHNKNFNDDNLLMYTAIHEYAHHIHSCKNGGGLPARAHTTEFWAIFHKLLEKAESKKIYYNAYNKSEELNELTGLIREKYIKQNGTLFIELGKLLFRARELCEKAGLRFEDYIDRVLCLPRNGARAAIKSFSLCLEPALGQDNMRFVSAIRGEEERQTAQNALLSGSSVDTVKMALRPSQEEEPRFKLEKEKGRLIRTIDTLSKRLAQVEAELLEF
ncbi:MAG: hypothetical protein Pg6A_02680 [Termitinemataceae bacterium]|jgi:hypothetical protein|nr:MAG: hypothetical protein Pg6A_02680 [Termitinemataceae bacterium]